MKVFFCTAIQFAGAATTDLASGKGAGEAAVLVPLQPCGCRRRRPGRGSGSPQAFQRTPTVDADSPSKGGAVTPWASNGSIDAMATV